MRDLNPEQDSRERMLQRVMYEHRFTFPIEYFSPLWREAILSKLEGFPGDKAHEEVGYGGTCSTHEDGELASIPIRQRAIEKEGEAIDPGAHHEDGGEVPIGHEGIADACSQSLGQLGVAAALWEPVSEEIEVSKGMLADLDVVAAHVQERVGQSKR